ncbi:MAG: hypothetical protein KA239_11725, partial [Bacteroidia bacterium]|nr:hypothetical protein [Bacteroidia bacterium]
MASNCLSLVLGSPAQVLVFADRRGIWLLTQISFVLEDVVEEPVADVGGGGGQAAGVLHASVSVLAGKPEDPTTGVERLLDKRPGLKYPPHGHLGVRPDGVGLGDEVLLVPSHSLQVSCVRRRHVRLTCSVSMRLGGACMHRNALMANMHLDSCGGVIDRRRLTHMHVR